MNDENSKFIESPAPSATLSVDISFGKHRCQIRETLEIYERAGYWWADSGSMAACGKDPNGAIASYIVAAMGVAPHSVFQSEDDPESSWEQ